MHSTEWVWAGIADHSLGAVTSPGGTQTSYFLFIRGDFGKNVNFFFFFIDFYTCKYKLRKYIAKISS